MKKVFSFFKDSNNSQEKRFVEVGNNKFLKNFKKITLILYAIFIFLSYYVTLVPINLKSIEFYGYSIFMLAVLTLIFFIDSFFNDKSKILYKILSKIILIMIVLAVISNIYSSPLFNFKHF